MKNIVFKKLIRDVYCFDINPNYLAYVNVKHNECSLNDLIGNEITRYHSESNGLTYPIKMYEDGFFWMNIPGPIAILFKKNKIEKLNYPLTAYLPDDKSSYAFVKEGEKGFYIKYDENGTRVWKAQSQTFNITHPTLDYCFFRKGFNGLTTLNNQTGEALWTYTLPDKEFDYIPFDKPETASISKILGIYNNVVWLALNSGALVGLSVETGALVKHVVDQDYVDDKPCGKPIERNGAFFHSSVVLDHDKGIIFTCIADVYAEVDLNQKNYPFSVWYIKEELAKQPSFSKDHDFQMRKIAGWEGDTVYVYDNSWSHCFGAFDRKTRTILWSQIFDGPETGWGAIFDAKYSNGHFYIHANADNALHIYQLNENKK